MSESRDWNGLRRALRELHRVLAERAGRDYAYAQERLVPLSRGEFLQLLAADPEFAWLRGLSELMVEIDEAEETDAPAREEFALGVRKAVERFISPPPNEAAAHAFARRYWPYVQQDPHVAMAHAAVKRALSTWP